MIIPEYIRILKNGTKTYAEFFYPRGSLGAPAYEWWDLEMCLFKYNQLQDLPGSDVILQVIKELNLVIGARVPKD